jgi:hypothetical protein
MEAAKLLDDPDHINTFLSMIGPPRTTDRSDTAPENKKDERELGNEQVRPQDEDEKAPCNTVVR